MANTYKVKRGMVFWYNLDERVDKNADPAIIVNGKERPDHRQYGMRHWLVISNNIGNSSSPTCNAVPITGAYGKANIPTHVPVLFRGRKFEVLCEQVMTVNTVSLQEYAYTLSDADMKNVDKALMIQFDLSQAQSGAVDDAQPMLIEAQRRMEQLMNQFENKNVSLMDEYEKQLSGLLKSIELKLQAPVQDAIEPKHAGQTKTFQHPTHNNDTKSSKSTGPRVPANKHLSQIEKFNARYPEAAHTLKMNCKETEKPQKKETDGQPNLTSANTELSMSNKKRKWTKDMMEEYLHDTDTLSPMQTVEKWGMKDIRSVYSMKYYLQNRLDSLAPAN